MSARLLRCFAVAASIAACDSESTELDATPRVAALDTCSAAAELPTLVDVTAWTTATALLPAPAMFVRPTIGATWLGGTPVFAAADTTLTWLLEFDAADVEHHVWVRSHGGLGLIAATVNDVPVTPAPITWAPNGWWRIGSIVPGAGRKHLDLRVPVDVGVDAILVTRDASLSPTADTAEAMPGVAAHGAHGRAPTDAPRAYRFLARSEPVVLGWPERFEEDPSDWTPSDPGVPMTRRVWAAAGGRVNLAIAAGASAAMLPDDRVVAQFSPLVGPATIAGADVRLAMRRRSASTTIGTDDAQQRPLADVLVHSDVGCAAGESLPDEGQAGARPWAWTVLEPGDERLFVVSFDVPADAPPGVYVGELRIGPKREVEAWTTVTVELEVLPLVLADEVSGENGIYYPLCPSSSFPACGDTAADMTKYKPDAAVRDDLAMIAGAGFDSIVAYGGSAMLPMLADAGLDESVTLTTGAPDALAIADIDAQLGLAASLGIGQVSYYIHDEPTVADLPRLLARLAAIETIDTTSGSPFAPFSATVAINGGAVWSALVEAVDHAIMEVNVFWEACGPMDLRSRPHDPPARPIAYWAANRSNPRNARILGGLWPRAVGYLGISPWSFQDPAPLTGLNDFTVTDIDGATIPTRDWLALGEGLQDVRFLDALDAALERAKHHADKCDDAPLHAAIAAAHDVRETNFRCLPWSPAHGFVCPAADAVGTTCLAQMPRSAVLLGVGDDALDARRRAMADAAITLDQAIAAACP